jgi:outer membrane lipopolysaccharide assembly protein LptE/RlpB
MRATILGLALILTGCASGGGYGGGHGGGLPSRLPPELYRLYIETTEPDSAFYRAMRQELMAQGIRVADLRTDTNAILRISREYVERRAGSAGSGDRNAPREYQLTYTATFVVTVDGDELLFPETVSAYRNYTAGSGPGSSMMRSAEEDAIVENLAHDMARQAMRRLTRLR